MIASLSTRTDISTHYPIDIGEGHQTPQCNHYILYATFHFPCFFSVSFPLLSRYHVSSTQGQVSKFYRKSVVLCLVKISLVVIPNIFIFCFFKASFILDLCSKSLRLNPSKDFPSKNPPKSISQPNYSNHQNSLILIRILLSTSSSAFIAISR